MKFGPDDLFHVQFGFFNLVLLHPFQKYQLAGHLAVEMVEGMDGLQ